MTALKRFSTRVHSSIGDFFYNAGLAIAKRPILSMVIPTLISGLLCIGLVNFKIETDGEKLFTPQDSIAWTYKSFVEDTFGFDPVRIQLYGTSAGQNILTSTRLLRLHDVLEASLNSTSTCAAGSCKDKTVTFSDVALLVNGKPKITSVLDFFPTDNRRAAIAGASAADITRYINNPNATDSTGARLAPVMPQLLGGVTRNGRGEVTSAEAAQVTIQLDNDVEKIEGLPSQDPEITAWSIGWADFVHVRSASSVLTVYPLAEAKETEVQDATLAGDITLIIIGYIIITTFVNFLFIRPSAVLSRSNLGFWAVIAVGLAIGATFGLTAALGVKFNLVTQSLALLLLGLGIDDAAVIVDAFSDTVEPDRDTRIAKALSRAGASITVTSLTDLAAFAIGSSTSLPALRTFCIYASIGVFLLFSWQVIFFTGALALNARRQERGKRDDCCCGTAPLDQPFLNMGCLRAAAARNAEDENSSRFISTLIGHHLPKLTLHPVGKVVVLVITATMLGFSIYGATQVKMDFQIRWFTPDSSWIKDVYAVQDKYFGGSNIPFAVYTRQVDYFAHRTSLDTMANSLKSTTSVVPESIQPWFTALEAYRIKVGAPVPSTSTAYYAQLRTFLDSSEGAPYRASIVFTSAARTQIKASKTFGLYTEAATASRMIHNLDVTRVIAGNHPELDAISYGPVDLFTDGYRAITTETLRNVGTALVAVFVICLVTLADLQGAVLTMLMVLMVDAGLLGIMYYTGIDYNAVSSININLAIGFSVDQSAHIAHAYLVVRGTRDERAQKAMRHIGGAVFNGALSTFLAVLPLAGSQSYVFQVFFTMWASALSLAVWHGIVVLPVVLSFVGPPAVAAPDTPKSAPKVDPEIQMAEPHGLEKGGASTSATRESGDQKAGEEV